MQGQRYWVERAFEDAKGECGLADYQAVGWRAWHHHVTMVMLAMLFIAEQRVAHQPGLALLTPRDIVEMLKETLAAQAAGQGRRWSPGSTSVTHADAAPSNPATARNAEQHRRKGKRCDKVTLSNWPPGIRARSGCMPRPFHLGWFLQGSSVQAWGEPWTGAIGRDWMVPDLFCDMARALERACFDYILIEDSSMSAKAMAARARST